MSSSPVITCHKPAPAELNCKPDLTCFEQGCWQEQGYRWVRRSASKLSGMRGHQVAEDCRRPRGRCHFQVLGKHRAEPVLVAFSWQREGFGASSAGGQALGIFLLAFFHPGRLRRRNEAKLASTFTLGYLYHA